MFSDSLRYNLKAQSDVLNHTNKKILHKELVI